MGCWLFSPSILFAYFEKAAGESAKSIHAKDSMVEPHVIRCNRGCGYISMSEAVKRRDATQKKETITPKISKPCASCLQHIWLHEQHQQSINLQQLASC